MTDSTPRSSWAGLRVTSLGTLASRVLGLVRDIATAALFGLAGGGVMDAFVVAFRIPNLFRRLFGEGALAASYLPVLSAELEHDRRSAWRLASVTLTWLTVVLVVLLLLAEGLFALLYAVSDVPQTRLLVGLAATMMPYMVFICLTAQLAATLHALSHFTMPAVAPILLNVCWLAGVWLIAPYFESKAAQAYVIAVCVLVSGALQLALQLPPLLRHGFRFDYGFAASRGAVRQVLRPLLPMMFGLAVVQLNTLVDVLIAWGFARTPASGSTIAWLGGVGYPLTQGAAAAVYYGERLYQFPLGILGVAVATVIFPLLSRHAARGDLDKLGADLTLGLRLVVFLALPASLGLVLLAEPLARLLFEHGEFTADDAARTADMIAGYGVGVWAYCALPVLIRGYYALGRQTLVAKTGAVMVGFNLVASLALIWPLGELGLALTTAASAALQVTILALVFSRQASPIDWSRLARTIAVSSVATLVMGVACLGTLALLPEGDGATVRLAAVIAPLTAGVIAYFFAAWLLGAEELSIVWSGVER